MTVNLGGRPLKFATPEELAQKIQKFFDLVKSGDEAPSVIGLAVYLGTNKQTILNYQEKDEYAQIINAAKERIEAMFTAKAYSGDIPPAIFIFTAKNHYQYEDEHGHKHSGEVGVKNLLAAVSGNSTGLPTPQE